MKITLDARFKIFSIKGKESYRPWKITESPQHQEY
jgi:hypothetical protein